MDLADGALRQGLEQERRNREIDDEFAKYLTVRLGEQTEARGKESDGDADVDGASDGKNIEHL